MDCTVNHTHDHLKSPCPCPQSVELGVPWLPIRFLNAANSRNTCHLDCYPILSQRDSSHLNLCLCLQTCLFPKCCFWWIAVSEYHALCRELIKQREFFFFLAEVSPGLSVPLSSAPLHFSIPDGTPDGQHYHICQKGDSVCVTLQLDNWSALPEMWRICSVRRRHKYTNREIRTEWSDNMCLGIFFKVTYGIELKL